MKFKSPTDEPVQLSLTSGHTCVVQPESIEPDGTDITPMFHREAIVRGCIPVGIEIPVTPAPAGPQFDRKKIIADGMRAMLESDDEGMFTGAGKPNITKLNAIVGFKTEREEVDAIWAEIEAELSAGVSDGGDEQP